MMWLFSGISLKITSSLCHVKPKVHWSKEYCTLHSLVVYFIDGDGNIQHNSLCFISDNNNHDTIFFIKHKQFLLITFQLWIRSSISLTAVLKNVRIAKTLLICGIISKISIWVLNGYSLQLVMATNHVMVLGDFLNAMLQNEVYKDYYMTNFWATNQCLIYVQRKFLPSHFWV